MSPPLRPGAPPLAGAAAARVRPATAADLAPITAIAVATGQDEDFGNVFPAYVGHLLDHGALLVAEVAGKVTGYGAAVRIGQGAAAISMLTDLFIDPAAHGQGIGRAILTRLWAGQPRRMTFASLHPLAVPLYTAFGASARWPLFYIKGPINIGKVPGGWSVARVTPEAAAALERAWTGADRTAGYRMWAARPAGAVVIASHDGRPLAAAAVGGPDAEFGIIHLAMDPAARTAGPVRDPGAPAGGAASCPEDDSEGDAAGAVLAVIGSLDAPGGIARVCLPGPHPAVRPLLAAGWRISQFDLHMSSEPDLIDPLRTVPSPALA